MKNKYELDKTDMKILKILAEDGKISNVQLADKINLSQSPCLSRVKRLEALGFIKGYRAEIDTSSVFDQITIFTEVTLKNHRHVDFSRFQDEINSIDYCRECHLISGGYDYLVKFVCPNIKEYQRVVNNLLEKNVGIDKYFSYIVIKTSKATSLSPVYDNS